MEAVVRLENIQRALQLVERVAAKNATLPILGNILLKAEAGQLRLSATNLEVGISVGVSAKVVKNGALAVPARLLSDLMRASRADAVSLKATAKTLAVVAGSSETEILCFDAAEYPIIPTLSEGEEHQLPAEEIQTLCASVVDAIATTDSRPELAGAFFCFHQQDALAAATDSFRLVERGTSAGLGRGAGVIIPRATVTEVVRAFGGITGTLTIRIAQNQILFAHENTELVSRLIDGRFPDYQKVIPDKFLSRALINRGELADIVRVAALFSSSISDIVLSCSEKEVRASGKHTARGAGAAQTSVILKGDPFEISLNYHYLLEGLKVIPTQKIILEFTGKGSPLVLRPDDNTPLVYLVMPLRG